MAIGLISYSLYLWHWPVFVLFRWTVGFDTPAQKCFALAIAGRRSVLISYFLVERPLRGRSWLRPPLRAIPIALVAVGLLAWGIGPHVRQFLAALGKRGHGQSRATGIPSRDRRDVSGCRVEWRTRAACGSATSCASQRLDCDGPDATTKLFVVGDSHATAYLAMLPTTRG